MTPVNALDLPSYLNGTLTLCSGLHHFPPEQAKTILRQAYMARQNLFIFENTSRTCIDMIILFLNTTIGTLFFTPFIKPFRLSRLFLTYLIPIIPALITFDGIISCLRSYSKSQLSEMIMDLADQNYTWIINETKVGPFGRLLSLIGRRVDP